MKKLLCILSVLLVTISVPAQKKEPQDLAQNQQRFDPKKYEHVDPKKDQRVMQGYTVRLRPGMNLTYLFDILDKDKLVHEPTPNVLNSSPEGYSTKEDAYTTAAWVIDQYKKTGHIPPMLPPDMMNKLKTNPNQPHR